VSDAEPAVVLIVDDEIVSVMLLEQALRAVDGIVVRSFTDPRAALEAVRSEGCDLLITDVDMPGMTGLELIAACRDDERARDVPIVVLTASTQRDLRRRAMEAGALDFLSKPLDAAEVRARARNMVDLSVARRQLSERSALLAAEVRNATSTIAARERETILGMARASDYRDWETRQHLLRISEYSRIIGTELGLEAEFVEELSLAAPLHDIGKIGIPDYVLRKPERLDTDEFLVMQRHTVIGHSILKENRSRLLQRGAEIALTHHEKLDGSGYPQGLLGDAIPLSGRIVAIADVFDAVTTRRPYQAPFPVAYARSVLMQGMGTHFDADCLAAFLKSWDFVIEIHRQLADEAQPDAVADLAAGAVGS
jgi:putative two-component system response regulator